MLGWETILAGVIGLIAGVSLAATLGGQRARRERRSLVELETRVRRSLVPVLERRADALGIPPSSRGSNDDRPLALALTLAEAIKTEEESAELPFGDTLEVARKELDIKLAMRGGDKA